MTPRDALPTLRRALARSARRLLVEPAEVAPELEALIAVGRHSHPRLHGATVLSGARAEEA